MKEYYFKGRELGEDAEVVVELRRQVTEEQLRLMKFALDRLLSDSPPPDIEETMILYGYTP